MKTLQELGIYHGTDKATHHKYCNFYDYHLSFMRLKAVKILEIGIQYGKSLKMWRDYFPNSEVYGIDIDPNSMLKNHSRIKTFTLDAGDHKSLENFIDTEGPFSLVIDDGSHYTDHQWLSWDLLSDNCDIFIWEDLHTSRRPKFLRGKRDGLYPLDYAKKMTKDNPDTCFLFQRDINDETDSVTFIKNNLLEKN